MFSSHFPCLAVVLLTPTASAVGYCNDKSTSCGGWAKDGECQGNNAECAKAHTRAFAQPGSVCCLRACRYLSLLCPHSCGTCTHKCEDGDVSCGNWAKGGQCKSNAQFMNSKCPTSCGLCTPTCKDIHEDCMTWMHAGACGDNPLFMLKHW